MQMLSENKGADADNYGNVGRKKSLNNRNGVVSPSSLISPTRIPRNSILYQLNNQKKDDNSNRKGENQRLSFVKLKPIRNDKNTLRNNSRNDFNRNSNNRNDSVKINNSSMTPFQIKEALKSYNNSIVKYKALRAGSLSKINIKILGRNLNNSTNQSTNYTRNKISNTNNNEKESENNYIEIINPKTNLPEENTNILTTETMYITKENHDDFAFIGLSRKNKTKPNKSIKIINTEDALTYWDSSMNTQGNQNSLSRLNKSKDYQFKNKFQSSKENKRIIINSFKLNTTNSVTEEDNLLTKAKDFQRKIIYSTSRNININNNYNIGNKSTHNVNFNNFNNNNFSNANPNKLEVYNKISKSLIKTKIL